MNQKLIPPSGTDLLCKNIVETGFDQLSEDNIRIFKDRLLDMTGCIFGGAIVEEDRFLEDRLKRWGGMEEAPLFASSGRLPLPQAVMLNCIKARANDYGSMLFIAFGEHMPSHMGETLIPMNLTLADVFGVNGKDFITHNIASEDFAARILYSLPNRWPTDMLLTSSAAAALAGRYYGLNAKELKAALSFGATNATDPGNAYYDYSQEFKYHNGASGQMGIMAAELAKGGWMGLEDPYFGHWGLVSGRVEGGGLPSLYEKCFEELGALYITEQGFKRGPGGIPTSAAASCGTRLRRIIMEKYGQFRAEDIKQIHVFTSDSIPKNYYNEPFLLRNHTNALFSYQFAACCALLNGRVTVDLVQTAAISKDSDLIRLAEESTMELYKSEPGKKMIRVIADMKDGSSLEAEEDYFSMARYPDRKTLIDKFWSQFHAFGRLPDSYGEKIIQLAGKVENISDMREYTELLCVK